MQDWQSRFDELKSQFISRLDKRILALEHVIESLGQKPDDMELLREIRQHFHWLAGSGGIYGFDSVTRYGLHGEEVCDFLLKDSLPAGRSDIDKMMHLVNLIRKAMTGQTGTQTLVLETRRPSDSNPRLLYVSNNPDDHQGFLKLLGEQKIQVESVSGIQAARDWIMARLPEILVLSLPLKDGTGYELAELVRSMPGGDRSSIVAVSKQAHFLDKVEAIKSGVDCFFEKPIEDSEIADKIKHLLDRDKPEHYRILSVEDDPDQAAFIKLTLESAGYSVVSLQDATKFEETFLQFEPDMVLLDVMLGPMTGFEIAQYIRQQDRYAALPVVFLTTENALEMHVKSARIGGDDHLLKPIAPQLLAAAVSGRLEKARVLKKLIERDILTGCLAHGPFMERAAALIANSAGKRTLTMALFDIDSMKVINKRFGFAVGDKVLSTMGPLLAKKLRNSLLIGRTGANRFAAIFEGLTEGDAEVLGYSVISDFSKIKQHSMLSDFTATASGAICTLTTEMDLESWIARTERLLAESKNAGGNRISSAQASKTHSQP